MLYEGQQVELTIEKPASGGRMIARHLGQIVLVRGAIPGERVTAWIERAEKQRGLRGHARRARGVTRSGRSRRSTRCAAACSTRTSPTTASCAQKRRDSRRVRARRAAPLECPVRGPGSPDRRLSDAGPAARRRGPRRLLSGGNPSALRRRRRHGSCRTAALAAVESLARSLERAAPGVLSSISISENIRADQRAAHLELTGAARLSPETLDEAGATAALTGVSAQRDGFDSAPDGRSGGS